LRTNGGRCGRGVCRTFDQIVVILLF